MDGVLKKKWHWLEYVRKPCKKHVHVGNIIHIYTIFLCCHRDKTLKLLQILVEDIYMLHDSKIILDFALFRIFESVGLK